MEKLGEAHIFFCEKYKCQLQINKRLLGGNNILLKVVFSDNPHANYQRCRMQNYIHGKTICFAY